MLKIDTLTREDIGPLSSRRAPDSRNIMERVQGIVDRVIAEGDEALVDFTRDFDGVTLTAGQLRVTETELDAALAAVETEFIEALRVAVERIRDYHERHKPEPLEPAEADGASVEQIIRPLGRVGIYVPGGQANYPSSVLMNAIPAQVAGVTSIAMCVPPGDGGAVSKYALAAARLIGLTEVYRVGGAQAIAALAYGTETIAPVDKITGPGNAYVTAAKKLVTGQVDIDMLAGPSEVLILADDQANPEFVAADMLAQAEHDPMATAIVVTTSAKLAAEVQSALDRQLGDAKRREVARRSLENNGRLLVSPDLDLAIDFANAFAPEHLEIMLAEGRSVVDRVRNAGAIFIGSYTPEALGDYVAGSNHILPTGGTARYGSPLGVEDFVKRSSVLEFSAGAMRRVAPAAALLAAVEGLEAHRRSVTIRMESDG